MNSFAKKNLVNVHWKFTGKEELQTEQRISVKKIDKNRWIFDIKSVHFTVALLMNQKTEMDSDI